MDERASVRPVVGAPDAARAPGPVRPDRRVRRSPPRFTGDQPAITGDLDICYARDDDNLERLADALRSLDAHLRGAPRGVPFQLDARTLRAGDHLTFSTSVGALDILGTPSGTKGFADLDANATDEVVDGLTVRVASIEDLIRMKRAAGRPKDLVAVEWLSAVRDELEADGAG